MSDLNYPSPNPPPLPSRPRSSVYLSSLSVPSDAPAIPERPGSPYFPYHSPDGYHIPLRHPLPRNALGDSGSDSVRRHLSHGAYRAISEGGLARISLHDGGSEIDRLASVSRTIAIRTGTSHLPQYEDAVWPTLASLIITSVYSAAIPTSSPSSVIARAAERSIANRRLPLPLPSTRCIVYPHRQTSSRQPPHVDFSFARLHLLRLVLATQHFPSSQYRCPSPVRSHP